MTGWAGRCRGTLPAALSAVTWTLFQVQGQGQAQSNNNLV